MFNKKQVLFILFLLCGILAISSVHATDVHTDAVAADDNSQNVIESSHENPEVSASDDVQVIQQPESEEILDAAPSYGYKINLDEEYEIQATKSKTISYTVGPATTGGSYLYDYGLYVIQGDNIVELHKKSVTTYVTGQKTMSYKFNQNKFTPGTYILAAVNTADSKVMDAAWLKVSGEAVIESNDFNDYYNSGHTMTAKLTDKKTGAAVMRVNVRVTFTNGKNTLTQTYVTDNNGLITITPPKDIGTYTVTITSGDTHIQTAPIQKAAVIKQAPVNVKAYKITEYKGFKTTIKAKVTSNGKDVNEGTVTFKINGKTYNVAVKNGWATKTIKLSKTKTYKYTAKFNGNANLQASKKVKANAVLKKRLNTKIVMKKHYTIYSTSSKIITIKVKTTSGKNVKDGKLKIRSNGMTSYATVKNGKAKVLLYGLGMKHFKSMRGNTETYKKVINKVVKLKYIPESHKYKSSSKNVKATSRFKCPGCGKTTTHNHYAVGYFYTHVQVIRVV